MKFRAFAAVSQVAMLLAVTFAPAAYASSEAVPSASGSAPTLTVGWTAVQESTLDPTKNINVNAVTALSLETLLEFGAHGQLEPYLATSWAQTGPDTYVYHLRPGVKFWDGDELTSADVVYSWDYERSPGSQVGAPFNAVKSITASGPYTVVVTLAHPYAAWQWVPAERYSEIFEMKFAEAHKGTFGNPGVLVMGTGPWEIDSLDPTTGAELSANPNWWGGKVPYQRVAVKLFNNDTSLALAMRAGEVDLDPSLAGAQQSFASTSGAKLVNSPGCDQGMFSMNTQVAPWNDVHVRRAVAYALNRTDLIAANGGYATPTYTLIPPQSLLTIASQSQVDGLMKSTQLYGYNVASAKDEMAQSAYPHGFTASILEFSSGGTVNVSEAVAGELQAIGIRLQVKVVTIDAWLANIGGPDKGRAPFFVAFGCTIPDAAAMPDFFLGTKNLQNGEYNTAVYNPPEVNSLVNQGDATTDPRQRFQIYSKLLRVLATDVPYVPLFNEDYSIALANNFTTVATYNQWNVEDDDYALDVTPAS